MKDGGRGLPTKPPHPFAKARSSAPVRDQALLRAAQKRLGAKLSRFFKARAKDVAAQIARSIGASANKPKKASDDDIEGARAAAILTELDLGEDWKVELLDGTAEELAAMFEDGTTAALPLVGFVTGTETINEARANVGLPPVPDGDTVPAIVSQPNEAAIAWARENAADLITGIEDRTREMLRERVVQALEEGWGARELADNIGESAAFSDARAETIARTELIRANGQGALNAYKDSGVATGKVWQTAGDDLVDEEICAPNEDQGPIPLDEDFDSGDDAPPGHPNCRCSLGPWLEPLDEGEDEEG